MGFRYRVNDLPLVGASAFTPLPTTNPIASSYGLVNVNAWLGTRPIPVPAPTRVWAPTPNNASQVQGSNVAPDYILPTHYVAYADNMGPSADAGIGMSIRRRNPLPVPAVMIQRTANPAMMMRKVGGRVAMAWPRAFQRFPTSNNSNG